IGTAAAVDAALVARLLARHGADRLAVGIDARDGRLAARGSTTVIDLAPVELARRVQALGARTVIYTDAARDGTLTGPDLVAARRSRRGRRRAPARAARRLPQHGGPRWSLAGRPRHGPGTGAGRDHLAVRRARRRVRHAPADRRREPARPGARRRCRARRAG